MATTLKFSGLTWTVRQSGTGGPGPNNWSPDNAFVDGAGNLHLKLTYQNGSWYAAEIQTDAALGFGTYTVQLASPVAHLDKNVVAGFFTYPTPAVGADGTNEIDIEFATWGGQQNDEGNWTVWPANAVLGQSTQSFAIPASDSGAGTYGFAWASQSVTFQSASGGGNWSFAPANPTAAIGQQPVPFHMNLWLFGGAAPSNGQQVDMVISGFTFTPLGQSQAIGPSASAADAVQANTATAVADSAGNVLAKLDGLEILAKVGLLTGITLTDGGIPALSVSATQLAADHDVLAAIGDNFTLTIAQPAAGQGVSGLTGRGTTVLFSGNAAQYGVTPSGDGISFTVAGSKISGVTALKFVDYTDFVVSTTPAASGGVSSAQVTELYSAVLARTPDVPGLAYYEAIAASQPSLSIVTFAEWFLQSPEYTGNSAHGYAQTAAGEAAFVTDTYANLLHRAPESGAVAWYQAHVIAPILGNAAPGSAAYTTAELLAHAALLADFSQSAEFLADVAITAQHPADAQHWLILI